MAEAIRVIAILELVTGVGLILFWVGFFTIGLAPKNPPKGYLEYEHSFPAAGWIAGRLAAGGGHTAFTE